MLSDKILVQMATLAAQAMLLHHACTLGLLLQFALFLLCLGLCLGFLAGFALFFGFLIQKFAG